jgi:DNA repair exonuclease SbcCD ATPase subunit
MNRERYRPLWQITLVVALVWVLAFGGYRWAQSTRITAAKVATYLRTVDLASLSGVDRQRALTELARQLNALSYDERRQARLDREWQRWFTVMTEDEKGEFIEATLPAGFKQMLTAFEELPEARRKRALDDALKRLREAREQWNQGGGGAGAAQVGDAPVISDALQQKVTTLGLKAYYSQSSAQTKAELAPLLEELQRMMERGVFLRGRGG